jgi:ABC-type multidrug transport system ATPase subunit
MTGRTTFLIAHRPETIQLADRILLLDRGRLLATGTHEALLAQSVLYPQLRRRRVNVLAFPFTKLRLYEKANYRAMSNGSGVLLLPAPYCIHTWLMWIESTL